METRVREMEGEAEGKRGFSGVEREGHTGVRSGSLSLAAFQSLCVQKKASLYSHFLDITSPALLFTRSHMHTRNERNDPVLAGRKCFDS